MRLIFFDEIDWIAVLLKNGFQVFSFIFSCCDCVAVCPRPLEQSLYTVDFVSSWVVAIVVENLISVGRLPVHLSL